MDNKTDDFYIITVSEGAATSIKMENYEEGTSILFSIAEQKPTALTDTEILDAKKAKKIILNGQMVIIRNGELYDITGRKL